MEPSLTEELRPLFAGRKVVLTGGPLAALTGVCRRVRELGAERPFLLATGMGTGEVPDPEEAEWCVVEVRAPDVVAEIRAAMRMLRLLPSDVVDALDRWDPERRALVLGPMFNELPEIAGRRVYGPRRPEWRRLEDKVLVDALWDELGVARAPSEVVAAEPGALRAAAGLRERVGYRGAFTVDGVLAAEGFLPTELNPRFGAGLATMTGDLPDLPVSLLDRALVEGEPLAFAAGDLERQVLAVADGARAGGAWTVTKEPADATLELAVAFEAAPAGRRRPAGHRTGCSPSARRGSAGSCAWSSTRTGCRPARRWPRWPWPPSPWPTSGSAPVSGGWSRPGRCAERRDAPPVTGGASLEPMCRAARGPGACLGPSPAGRSAGG